MENLESDEAIAALCARTEEDKLALIGWLFIQCRDRPEIVIQNGAKIMNVDEDFLRGLHQEGTQAFTSKIPQVL